MWGGKLSYSYLDIGSAKDGLLIPQSGGFTQDGKFIPFVGNYLVQSYRQTLNQQVSFVPFLGRSFDRSYLYLGAVRPLRKPRHPLKVSPDLRLSFPFPQARPG
jgi:hypothetical protein